MDYPPEINMKRTKPIPGGQTDEEYRRVMQRILEGLTKENLDVALFLCKDDIPQGREITSGLQFFRYLEDRDLVSQDNAVYIAEVLHIIKRMDLLKIIPAIRNKRHFEDEFLSYAYTNFSNYRVLTIHLLDELSQKDFEKFRYHCASHLRNRSLEECTNVLMLLRKLEEQDIISDDNYQDLISILKCVENARPLKMFQRLLDGDDTVAMPTGKQRARGQQQPQQAAFADRRNVQQMAQRQDQFFSLPYEGLRVEQGSRHPQYELPERPGAGPIVYNASQTVPKGGDRSEHYGYATNENRHYRYLPPSDTLSPEKDRVTYAFDETEGHQGRSMMREISANGNKVFSAEESTPKSIGARASQFQQRDSQDYRRFRSMPPMPNSPYQTVQGRHYSDTFDFHSMPQRYDTPPPSYSQELHHSYTYPQGIQQEMEMQPQDFPRVSNHPPNPSYFLPDNGYANMGPPDPPQSLPVYFGPHNPPVQLALGSLPRLPGYEESPPHPQNRSVMDLRRGMKNISMESLNSTGSDVRCILEKSAGSNAEAANLEVSSQPNIPRGATCSSSHQEEMEKLKKQNEELHELLKEQKSFGSYKMDKSPVGLCLLVDNVHYEKNFNENEVIRRIELNKTKKNKLPLPMKGLKDRIGSTIDADALESLFESFDFKVAHYKDLDERAIKKVFKEASGEDHSQYNCFLAIILAHGDNGCVFGVDSFPVQISDLQVEFCADGCPTLANKPKIFIIQACQGKKDMLSHGIPEADIDTDAPQPETLTGRSTPNKADFLLAYSTVPGYVSYRMREQGTFYIMKLVEVLDRYFETQDLLSMMIMVTNECSKYKNKTQVPMPIPTLRKKVYFHRKAGWVPRAVPGGRSPDEDTSIHSPTDEDEPGAYGVQSAQEASSSRGRNTSIHQVTGEQYE